MNELEIADPEIAAALKNELARQALTIELVAATNFASRAVLEVQGSVFAHKTLEGYPGKRYHGGHKYVDVIENLERKVKSTETWREYPGRVVGYKRMFGNYLQHIHLPIDPRQFFRLWLASTMKVYGHYVGTDKIGHFTDMGKNYFNDYQAARRRTASADYDLTSDQRSQVYLGLSGETPRTRRAVDETAGIVLTWRGRLFSTYYSSTCGGHTLAGRFLFKDGAIPPLDGVECPYCRGTKYAHWERTFSIAELTRGVNEYLSADGRTVGEVKQLQVLERAPSGHVLKVRVVGSSGTVDLSGKAFRKALGTMRLPSTRFHLEPARGGLRLVGSGFGHGVGLCQVGARGAARAGLDFLDILQYYYPHSRPVRISSAPDRGSG